MQVSFVPNIVQVCVSRIKLSQQMVEMPPQPIPCTLHKPAQLLPHVVSLVYGIGCLAVHHMLGEIHLQVHKVHQDAPAVRKYVLVHAGGVLAAFIAHFVCTLGVQLCEHTHVLISIQIHTYIHTYIQMHTMSTM